MHERTHLQCGHATVLGKCTLCYINSYYCNVFSFGHWNKFALIFKTGMESFIFVQLFNSHNQSKEKEKSFFLVYEICLIFCKTSHTTQ